MIETWQPDKVLKELLAIDPQSGMTYTINIKRNATETEPASEWKNLVSAQDAKVSVDMMGMTPTMAVPSCRSSRCFQNRPSSAVPIILTLHPWLP